MACALEAERPGSVDSVLRMNSAEFRYDLYRQYVTGLAGLAWLMWRIVESPSGPDRDRESMEQGKPQAAEEGIP